MSIRIENWRTASTKGAWKSRGTQKNRENAWKRAEEKAKKII
jgi:hypothetical protein